MRKFLREVAVSLLVSLALQAFGPKLKEYLRKRLDNSAPAVRSHDVEKEQGQDGASIDSQASGADTRSGIPLD